MHSLRFAYNWNTEKPACQRALVLRFGWHSNHVMSCGPKQVELSSNAR